MSGDQYREFEDDQPHDDEEPQDPDTLIVKQVGEVNGTPILREDFAAWDFRHRNCGLEFYPLFVIYPEKSRIPEFIGLVITCHQCREKFTKRP